MPKRTPKTPRGWTLEAWMQHAKALRVADKRFDDERDRRYAEVKAAEEKALRVKDEADKIALGLQRDNQVYKDEKANELREQINSERGLYATKEDIKALAEKFDASHAPVVQFMASQQGRSLGLANGWGVLIAIIMAGLAAASLFYHR